MTKDILIKKLSGIVERLKSTNDEVFVDVRQEMKITYSELISLCDLLNVALYPKDKQNELDQ